MHARTAWPVVPITSMAEHHLLQFQTSTVNFFRPPPNLATALPPLRTSGMSSPSSPMQVATSTFTFPSRNSCGVQIQPSSVQKASATLEKGSLPGATGCLKGAWSVKDTWIVKGTWPVKDTWIVKGAWSVKDTWIVKGAWSVKDTWIAKGTCPVKVDISGRKVALAAGGAGQAASTLPRACVLLPSLVAKVQLIKRTAIPVCSVDPILYRCVSN